MGAIFSLFFPLYVLFAIMLVVGVAAKTKSVKATLLNLFMVVIIPGHDIVPTHILAAYYCLSEPNPKTFIKKTVEYPESIYWEDNIYPGFNEEDRKLMIKQYLNGKYLKTIALNGDDGKVYVYSAIESDWNTSRAIKAREIKGNYYDQIDAEVEAIYVKGIQTTKEQMPKMNYSVVSNEVPLEGFSAKLLYSDETSVFDNLTGEVIGYSRRYMRFFYNAFPDINVGTRYFYPYEAECGGELAPNLIEEWIFGYLSTDPNGKVISTGKAKHGTSKHTISLEKHLYKKYVEGESK